MAGHPEIKSISDLKEIRHKIRETLQVLQLPYGFVEQAVDSRVKFQGKKMLKNVKPLPPSLKMKQKNYSRCLRDWLKESVNFTIM